ncbi:MAG TPA: TRAP transporter small permease [Syntrophorhabdaceae bacterium]|nr:TRAP transporter small permease [Syntrophorhabdaceae bacterium]
MNGFSRGVYTISRFMQIISGIFLTFTIFLTAIDVAARIFGHPVPGAVEIISMFGGIVIGFSVPITSWKKGHIAVDFVTNALPKAARNVVATITRCVGIGLSLLITWNMLKIGKGFLRGHEVSGTLQWPLYPVAFGLAACFFMLSIVLFCDILTTFGGSDE